MSPNIVDSYAAIVNPWDMTLEAYNAFPPDFWGRISGAFTVDPGERTWEEWFSIAVAEHAVYEGRYHVARQIRNYDWVAEDFANQCVTCVRETLAETKGSFEVQLPAMEMPRGSKKVTVHGIADYVEEDPDAPLWEFKCTSDITDAHLLQLACYLALSERTTGKLYAIKSGTIATIKLYPKNAAALLGVAMQKYDERPHTDIDTDIARFREGLAPLVAVDKAPADDDSDRPGGGTEFTLDDLSLDD